MLTKGMAKKELKRQWKMQKAILDFGKATKAYLKALDKYKQAQLDHLYSA